MKYTFLKTGGLLSFLISLFIISCNNVQYGTNRPSIKDTINLEKEDYHRMLEAYKDEQLTNDTLLLGFRIGMPVAELQEHLKELIEQGRIVNQNHKLYGLIPTNEYCSDDKDQVHQFVAELAFHLDKTGNVLNSIYADLYGPRFLDMLSQKRLKAGYVPSIEEIFESAAQGVGVEDDSHVKSFSEKLMKSYRVKYNSENHIIPDNFLNRSAHLWISQGRFIEVTLYDDYRQLCNDYLRTPLPNSENDFSELVLIGSLKYTSVDVAIAIEEKINNMKPFFEAMVDSLNYNQIQMEEQRVREKNQRVKEQVNESGI
jgi:hypothetical protein